MRDIIFRAKKVNDGEWIEGYHVKVEHWLDDHEMHIIFPPYTTVYPHCEFTSYDEIEPETLGQFTGLLDKNGNKIFEGDIVKTEFGRLCIFEWFENRVTRCWDLSPILTNSNLVHPAPYRTSIFDSEHLEVVGNIHDNPELLEESK